MRYQDAEHSTADATRELTNRNEMILQAEEKGRKADLEPLLTDDFWIVRASGVKQDRQAFLKAVSDNADLGRTADQTEVHWSGKCAVFTCRVTTTRNPVGSPGGRFWNTRLFVRHGEEWRCAAWQVMKIC